MSIQPDRTSRRRPHHVYIRRRIAVASAFFSLVAALGLGAGNVLANRGGEPASAPAVRQNSTSVTDSDTYLVQPGDTMWSIAEAKRDGANLVHFVDDLIALNGGTTLHVGQVISLP